MGPRWPQDGPKMAQDGPRWAQDRPKMAQVGPRCPQDEPKRPQDKKMLFTSGADIAIFPFFEDVPRKITIFDPQREAMMAPREAQVGPRWAQIRPRCPQDDLR